MEFLKYQHIERFGTSETQGIENGMCYVFPKIDGTNSQLWIQQTKDGLINKLCAGSRNRQLELDNDNAGFYNWACEQDNIIKFLRENPNLRLYGEWLVPHSLKTYRDNAWRNFYVFDVMEGERYLPYEEYATLLEPFGIEFIPPLCKVENPTYERLISQLEKNGYLIDDGKGIGEGIVIKNYNYKNKYGRVTWAKIVTNEFKAKHDKIKVTEIKESKIIEQEICEKFVTKSLVEKEFAKIENENGGWSSKYIPRLINTVYYCLVSEECWNFIKDFKYPTIDFKRLQYFCTEQVKLQMPNIF